MKPGFLKMIFYSGASLLLVNCHNNNPNSTGTQTGADTTMTAGSDSGSKGGSDTSMMQINNPNTGGVAKASNEFVTEAAGGGMMEVAMGQLAQKNAASQQVKDYGKMLETDHTKANAALMSVAAAENLSVPATMPEKHTAHLDEMATKTGVAFDKAYMDMMVEDHVKDIAAFRTAAASNSNEKVKAFAKETLPTLEKHLAKANAIKSSLK